MEKLCGFFEKAGLNGEKAAARLLCAFFAVNTVAVWSSKVPYDSIDYLSARNIPFMLISGVFVFLFLCLALFKTKTSIADRIILLVTCSLFFATVMFNSNDVYLYTVVCAVFAAVMYFCLNQKKASFPIVNNKYVTIGATVGLAVIFIVFVGGLTALRYKMYISPNFDFGIFAQMFDYMKTTGAPMTTCERDMLLSHFDVHLSFIYYLILPFYYVFSSPYTLNIAQAVVLASGVIPLYLICRGRKLSPALTLAIETVYIFYPALSSGCFYDIHENCFLTPLILWLLYSIDSDSTAGLILSAVLVCAVKEDAPMYVMFIAVYMFFAKKKILKPALLLGFSVIYFLVAVWYLDSHGDGAMLYRYANFSSNGGSIKDIIKSCVMNPGYVFSQCLNAEKFEFAIKILLPLGFIPLFCSKMYNYILLGPFMLINLMSNYPYQHSLDFQYNFGTAALLIYLTAVNISEFKEDKRRVLAGWCVAASIMGFLAFTGGKIKYIDYYEQTKAACEKIDEVIEVIPDDATVYSSTFILPHLYEHDYLYQLNSDNADMSGRTEYVVLDLRYDEFASLYPAFVESGFETVAYEEGAAAVLYCPFYTGADG